MSDRTVTIFSLICYVFSATIIGLSLYMLWQPNSAELKESCLQKGGTAVEDAKGVFEKCLMK